MAIEPISLIVGLGNPGRQYSDTRHNAGFWFIDKLCHQHHTHLNLESKFEGLVGHFNYEQRIIRVLQPMTYMNLSGQAIQKMAHFYKIQPQSILVVYDEIDLLPGTTRLKFDGGHAGHNGIKDIMARLGTKSFYRLRIGVGRPKHSEEVHNYVLSKPSSADNASIAASIDSALNVLPKILSGQIEAAMQQLHVANE